MMEFSGACYTSLTSSTPDVKLVFVVIEILKKVASVIPIHEAGKGNPFWPCVMDAGQDEIGIKAFLNCEKTRVIK